MIDMNHLRIFERVAALGSFSKAARDLGLPRSNISRAILKLEESLGVRLIERTTRQMRLTSAGQVLHLRLAPAMSGAAEAVKYVQEMTEAPAGPLRVSAGIGLGINVLGDALPRFLERYPDIRLDLHLESNRVDLLAEDIDVALRFGALQDSSLVSRRLGVLPRMLCAAPSYLAARGAPTRPEDLTGHRIVDMPTPDGRGRSWQLACAERVVSVNLAPAVTVDEVLTLHRLVRGGAGIGVISRYLCEAEIEAGRLVHVLPEWSLPAVPLLLVFPSRRDLAPAVRVFADFMVEIEAQAPWRREG
jgi:DNA-binding transcriptional LysR family regulator